MKSPPIVLALIVLIVAAYYAAIGVAVWTTKTWPRWAVVIPKSRRPPDGLPLVLYGSALGLLVLGVYIISLGSEAGLVVMLAGIGVFTVGAVRAARGIKRT